MTDAYDRVTYQGVTLNKRTLAAFLTAQARPKDDNDWTIFQGSYHPGVGASGGTHDGGGAIDVSPFNADQRVHALRAVGFAAWHRPAIPGVWGEHIHCELLGDHEASDAARSQWVDYRDYLDGLAGHAPDRTWHPFPKGGPAAPIFDYPAYVAEQKRITARAARAAAAVKNAIAALIRARKNTDDPAEKARIQRLIEQIRNSH